MTARPRLPSSCFVVWFGCFVFSCLFLFVSFCYSCCLLVCCLVGCCVFVCVVWLCVCLCSLLVRWFACLCACVLSSRFVCCASSLMTNQGLIRNIRARVRALSLARLSLVLFTASRHFPAWAGLPVAGLVVALCLAFWKLNLRTN